MHRSFVAVLWVAIGMALVGCNEDPPGRDGPGDVGADAAADASGVDGEGADGGEADGGTADAEGADAVGDTAVADAREDAGEDVDAGDEDAGAVDGGPSDGGQGDGGQGDAGPNDGGPSDGGNGDTGGPADSGPATDTGGPIDTGMGDVMSPIDAAPGDTGSGPIDSGVTCSGGQTACSGQCVDTQTSESHCGTCGNSCPAGGTCSSGQCLCPRYHTNCNGTCIPTGSDPNNCGSCGNTCASGEVCSAGQCTTSCLSGQTICGQQCVDLKTDSNNCGSCGKTCPSGQGCTNGTCVQKVPTNPRTTACKGGGPPILVNTGGKNDECLGNLAQTTFRWAICSCKDLQFQTKLFTDAFDSGKGPYKKGGFGGGVGSNGFFNAGNDAEINGALWTSSPRGLQGQKTVVRQKLHTGGDVRFENTSTVGGDAYVEGDVAGKGPITFQSTLYTNPSSRLLTPSQRLSYKKRVKQNVDVSTVCGLCKSGNRIPVKSIVQNHGGTNNDNGLINLKANALDQPGGPRHLELPCGEYYLSKIDVTHKTSIVAKGRTAIYIGGDVTAGTDFSIKPAPGAELDVFIAGDVTLQNAPAVGSPAFPAATRFYVGGANGWTLGNRGLIGAFIYAIPGGINGTNNNLEIFGGVYTENFSAQNDVKFHYDRGVLTAGEQCPPPPGTGNPGGDTGVDAGTGMDASFDASMDASMDTSTDAGMDGGGGSTTPVCKESGSSCASDGDCCSPLVCNSDGVCAVTSCTPLYNNCANTMKCCNGSCKLTADGTYVCLP